jgi:DNA-binding MarR family transcriptional regulator
MSEDKKRDFEQSSIFRLSKIVSQITRSADSLLRKQTSVSYSQFLVLMAIDCECEKGEDGQDDNCVYTQKQVAEALSETQAALSRQIENLRVKGLLTRKENKRNRREHVIEITDAGQEELKKAYRIMQVVNTNFFNPLTKNEHIGFDKKLGKLVKNLNL